jgi:membrane protease YdiL (CAAX protease family)
MFCTNCGKEIPNNVDKCPFCGTKIENTVPQQINIGKPAQPIEQENMKTNAFCLVGFICSLAFALGFIGAALPHTDYYIFGASVFTLLGLVFSIMGMVQAKKKHQKGFGLGLAGLILSILEILFYIVAIIIVIFFVDLIQAIADGMRNQSSSSIAIFLNAFLNC